MKKTVKYAALNLGILFMGLALAAFAGAAVEGALGLPLAVAVCLALAALMRQTWREICRMERLEKQLRHTHAASAAVRETPDLRVA